VKLGIPLRLDTYVMGVTSPTSSDLNPARITMYGAAWCGDCRRSKALLDRRRVDYDYIDLEVDVHGADRAKAISGRTQIPVVVFPDGTHFTEPTDAQLAAKLDEAIAA
jgi:mycoredoxin